MNDRMNKELNKINEMKVVKNIEEKQTEVEDLLSIKLLFFLVLLLTEIWKWSFLVILVLEKPHWSKDILMESLQEILSV